MSSNKRLRQAITLRFVDGLATNTTAFAVPLLVFALTHNIAWSGASFTFEWLPRLAAIPVAGPLVDRMGAAKFFVFADSLRAVILAATAGWLLHDPHAWPMVVAASVLTGMLAQSTFVAAEKLGVEVTGTKSLHHVQALQVGVDQTVQVLGPILGGVLLIFGGAMAFFGIVGMLVASVFLAAQLRALETTAAKAKGQRIFAGFVAGLNVIRERPALGHVIAGTAFYNLLLALLLTITPAIVEERFHRGTSSVSLLWSLAAAASVIAVGLAARIVKYVGMTRLGFFAGIVGCGACLVAGFTQNYWVYVACMMVFLMMDAAYAVFIRTARARLVPKRVYGSTLGIIVLLNLAPYPIAGALVAAVPFAKCSLLVSLCVGCTAMLTCWSFAAMDHHTLNEPQLAADAI